MEPKELIEEIRKDTLEKLGEQEKVTCAFFVI